jgi:hypothetical protein
MPVIFFLKGYNGINLLTTVGLHIFSPTTHHSREERKVQQLIKIFLAGALATHFPSTMN